MSLHVKRSLLALTIGLVMVAVALFALSCAPTPPALRFVDDSSPITDMVRVLCYETSYAETLVDDRTVKTDADGQPIDDLPSDCNYVAALHLKYGPPTSPDRPDHDPAYRVYATSWKPGTTTPMRATGDITISDELPLVLFDVVASLAWEPSDGDPVVEDLERGLLNASEYLYDVTDGRMAFGPVEIHTGGRHWNDADLRFLAANDYRPSAYVGGMVAWRIQYTTPVTAVVFSPGEVYLGRDWNRRGASDDSSGRWYTDDAHHTIIHEWAHYALFLYDEYQDVKGSGPSRAYCTCTALSVPGGRCLEDSHSQELEASVMAWQYKASELWHPGVPPPAAGENLCEKTEQFQIHDQSDWETLGDWYKIQGLTELPGLPPLDPPGTFAKLHVGPPLGLARDLFGRMPTGTPSPRPAPGQAIDIVLDEGLGKKETPSSQVYLLKPEREVPREVPPRILHQGKAAGWYDLASGFLGTIHILGAEPLGAEPEDELGIFVERQETEEVLDGGRRYTFIGDLSAAPITEDAWHASLDIIPILDADGSRLMELCVELTSLSHPDLLTPTVQLCTPDHDTGCSREEPMTPVGEATWIATVTHLEGSDELPRYGVLRVQAEGVGELIRWFQDGGGVPPAHDGGGSPVADGLLKVYANEAVPNSSLGNRVLFMPAASYQALTSSLGTIQEDQDGPTVTVKGVLEVPLDIDIVLPIGDACPAQGPGDHTLPVSVALTLFYDQSSVDRLIEQGEEAFKIDENNLQMLHYSRASNQWSQVPVAGRDPELNWIATVPVGEDGIYAIAWISATTVTTP